MVCIYVQERQRERKRRAKAQVVTIYKPMPSKSKFVIGVIEKSNGCLNEKKCTISFYCEGILFFRHNELLKITLLAYFICFTLACPFLFLINTLAFIGQVLTFLYNLSMGS